MRLLSKLDSWVCNGTHRILGFLEDRLALFTVMVLAAEFTFAVLFWCWLSAGESGSTTIRNLGLVVAATIGLPLAIWRSKVAERQAATSQRQSETAQRSLLNERYQKGAEMLGSEVLPVRLGGIYALAELAREHPEDYHTKIMSLLCAFVRHPVEKPVEAALPIYGLTPDAEFNSGQDQADDEEGTARPLRVREDVQEIMTVVYERSKAQIEIEKEEKYCLNLSGSNLKDVSLISANLKSTRLDVILAGVLSGANLSGAIMIDSNLSGAIMIIADLSDANLSGANLSGANLKGAGLIGARLYGADLDGADLDGAHLKDCRGLTQEQIDQATASMGIPPDLTDVVDAQTQKPLVWKERPIT